MLARPFAPDLRFLGGDETGAGAWFRPALFLSERERKQRTPMLARQFALAPPVFLLSGKGAC
eukprot:11212781-Heterocapsa_arctica.AAC.1